MTPEDRILPVEINEEDTLDGNIVGDEIKTEILYNKDVNDVRGLVEGNTDGAAAAVISIATAAVNNTDAIEKNDKCTVHTKLEDIILDNLDICKLECKRCSDTMTNLDRESFRLDTHKDKQAGFHTGHATSMVCSYAEIRHFARY